MKEHVSRPAAVMLISTAQSTDCSKNRKNVSGTIINVVPTKGLESRPTRQGRNVALILFAFPMENAWLHNRDLLFAVVHKRAVHGIELDSIRLVLARRLVVNV